MEQKIRDEIETFRQGNQYLHQMVQNILALNVDEESLKRFVWNYLTGHAKLTFEVFLNS